jgi:hypothetical protein
LEDHTHTLFIGTSLGIFKRAPGQHAFSSVEMFKAKAQCRWENVPYNIGEGPAGQI